MIKRIIVLLKNVIEIYYLKPDRDFGNILSNLSLCRPYLGSIINLNVDINCKEVYVCYYQVSRQVSDFL